MPYFDKTNSDFYIYCFLRYSEGVIPVAFLMLWTYEKENTCLFTLMNILSIFKGNIAPDIFIILQFDFFKTILPINMKRRFQPAVR